MKIPAEKHVIIEKSEKEVKEIEAQYTSGLVTQGERYNKVVDIWGRAGDEVAKAMMTQLARRRASTAAARLVEAITRDRLPVDAGVVQLDLHDGRLRRARFRGADPAARRHARPDGQAGRLDHRDADHRELPRGPQRPAVLHLDPRRPQGSGRHRAQDRQLRLPDAASGRRHAGPGGDRGRLRHHQRRRDEGAGRGRRGDRGAARAHPRPRTVVADVVNPGDAGDAVSLPARCWTRTRSSRSRSSASTRSRCARRSPATRATACAPSATAATWAAATGQHRRGGRRHRRAVDRRAGHAADDADLPHRRRGVAYRRRVAASRRSRPAPSASRRRCATSPTPRASSSSSRAPAK